MTDLPLDCLLTDAVERLADALAPRLAEASYAAPAPPEPWLTADDLATLLAVSPDWVRRHQELLGGRRLPGERSRVRFRLSVAEQAMSGRSESNPPRKPLKRERTERVPLLRSGG